VITIHIANKLKQPKSKVLTNFSVKKSIVKADNVITFTRTSLAKQGMKPKNINVIQKE